MKAVIFLFEKSAKVVGNIIIATIFTLCIGSLGVCLYNLIKEIVR